MLDGMPQCRPCKQKTPYRVHRIDLLWSSNRETNIYHRGPNGAGKTSFARQFLPAEASCPVFINADLIAAGLSPFQPERVAIEAGRLMVEQMRLYFQRGESFAVETTLASRSYARHIRQWRDGGYFVDLVFLKLDDVALAQRRVALRVSQGGHAIDQQTIDRRFHAGLRNLEASYKSLVNRWAVYDNSDLTPRLLEQGINP